MARPDLQKIIDDATEYFFEFERRVDSGELKVRRVVHARMQAEAGAPLSEAQIRAWRNADPKKLGVIEGEPPPIPESLQRIDEEWKRRLR